MYGQELCLPGDIFEPNPAQNRSEIADRINKATEALSKARHHDAQRRSHVNPSLHTSSHVFLRDDTVKRPFRAPYRGPYKVLKRNEKTYVIEIRKKPVTVSIDCLKPFFLRIFPEQGSKSPSLQSCTITPVEKQKQFSPTPPSTETYITKRGRIVKPVVRFSAGTK